ncbi:Coniferyl aldehyde dehydrogenase [Marinomonas spartinae]|uniref:coniferyl aldehyde dehydrogenase n=1 Tax=Marinomonas spartinae TaxID=1792290 RepID=UPI000808AE0A|nr:coniferyl aldehyde dehydrogenase [Marinomonas spartinae]SBS40022.1 Coniferyl aldehyde dehydrogenase [Marinomonas spartinae]
MDNIASQISSTERSSIAPMDPDHQGDPYKNLENTLFVLKKHSRIHPFPSFNQRLTLLTKLQHALLSYEEALLKALTSDYGQRAPEESRLIELIPALGEIKHAKRHLSRWMRSQSRRPHISIFPAKASVMYQPKGVVGIISPWNYPILLSLSPLVGALAAGNRVMLKASEFCPATNSVLRQLLEESLSEEWVAFVEGEVEVANAFSQLPFDHLLFTGSTQVGKQVMANAAQHLTPVTLELGGKSPVIVSPSANPKTAAESILFGKLINAGQTCVAPDYILCHRQQNPALIHHMKQTLARMYPNGIDSPDYTCLINEKQMSRLTGYLDEIEQQQICYENLMPQGPKWKENKLALHLLHQPDEQLKVMQEEIFGPILPLLLYNDLSEAIAYINVRPRPLATYLFSQNTKEHREVETGMVCGGLVINQTLLHVAQADLPFGGIGESGMGMYHAIEGFHTFSHTKAVLHKKRPNMIRLLMPPYKKHIHKLLKRYWRFL